MTIISANGASHLGTELQEQAAPAMLMHLSGYLRVSYSSISMRGVK